MDYSKQPIQPRPFQVEGINWLVANKRGMLTDDVGLGKTLQAAYAADTPVLISCPNHLVTQWYEWLRGEDDLSRQRQTDLRDAWICGIGMDTDDYVGAVSLNDCVPIVPNVPGLVIKAQGNYNDKLEAIRTEHDWCVMNMEMLQTHSTFLIDLGVERNWWNTIIFDESHHLRNVTAKRSRTAVILAKATPRVYCLTATPIWKELDDLFNQLQMVDPADFTSYNEFLDLFCVTEKTRFGTKVLGAKTDMIPELEHIMGILRLGRSYKTAGRQLPQSIPNYIKVVMPPELKNHYDEIASYWYSQLEDEESEDGMVAFENFSQILNALRLLARWPGKYEAAADIIETALHGRSLANAKTADDVLNPTPASKGRVLVFGWFHDTVNTAAAYFNEHIDGCHAVAITGDVKIADRRPIALNKANNVICATIATLTEGIDLSDCHTVIFLEEHYTPGSMHQALGRAVRERNRESNEAPTLVYYIHSKGTIDEAIHAIASRRAGTIRDVLRQALHI